MTVTEAYKVPFKFTGPIDKLTIEVKAMNGADKEEAEHGRKEAALKKGLSDEQHETDIRKQTKSPT
jgi:arylsulfatase